MSKILECSVEEANALDEAQMAGYDGIGTAFFARLVHPRDSHRMAIIVAEENEKVLSVGQRARLAEFRLEWLPDEAFVDGRDDDTKTIVEFGRPDSGAFAGGKGGPGK